MCQIQAPVSALSPSNPLLALPVPAATHAPHDKHHATPMQYTYLGAQRGSRSSRAAGLWGSAGSARTPDQDCRVSRGKAERTHASQTHASREEHAPHEPGKLEHRLRHLSHLELKHAKLVGAKGRVIDVERPIHRQLRRHARSHGARPGAGNSSQCHEVLNEYFPPLASRTDCRERAAPRCEGPYSPLYDACASFACSSRRSQLRQNDAQTRQ